MPAKKTRNVHDDLGKLVEYNAKASEWAKRAVQAQEKGDRPEMKRCQEQCKRWLMKAMQIEAAYRPATHAELPKKQ